MRSSTRTPPGPACPGTCRRCRPRPRSDPRCRAGAAASPPERCRASRPARASAPVARCRPRRSTGCRAGRGSRRRSRRPPRGCRWSCRRGRRSAPSRRAPRRRGVRAALTSSCELQPAVVGQPRDRAAHRGMHAVGAVEEVAAVRLAACAVRRRASPARTSSTGSGWVPWLTCGSCCGSPSSIRFLADGATAIVLARLYWPASSTTSRSSASRGILLALAKSHPVPPTTQPITRGVVGDEAGELGVGELGPAAVDGVELLGDPCSPSTPAARTSQNRFSTTACDCATTPMRHPCSLTSRAITLAEVNVLPVPGGPCTAR